MAWEICRTRRATCLSGRLSSLPLDTADDLLELADEDGIATNLRSRTWNIMRRGLPQPVVALLRARLQVQRLYIGRLLLSRSRGWISVHRSAPPEQLARPMSLSTRGCAV